MAGLKRVFSLVRMPGRWGLSAAYLERNCLVGYLDLYLCGQRLRLVVNLVPAVLLGVASLLLSNLIVLLLTQFRESLSSTDGFLSVWYFFFLIY